jgi:hypothetical protein
MKLTLIILGLVLAMASGCRSAPLLPGKCQAHLEALSAREPLREAEQAAHSASPYLLGIQGYSISFPGVQDPQVALKIGYRVLEGTSDAIPDQSCKDYQLRALRFAEVFNRSVMTLLGKPQP